MLASSAIVSSLAVVGEAARPASAALDPSFPTPDPAPLADSALGADAAALLAACWRACELAGVDPLRYSGRVGLFASDPADAAAWVRQRLHLAIPAVAAGEPLALAIAALASEAVDLALAATPGPVWLLAREDEARALRLPLRARVAADGAITPLANAMSPLASFSPLLPPSLPPSPASAPHSAHPWLFLLSALSPAALTAQSAALAAFLSARPHLDLAAAAFTLQVGRRPFACRRYVLAASPQDLIAALAAPAAPPPAGDCGDLVLPPIAAPAGDQAPPAYRELRYRCAEAADAIGLSPAERNAPASPYAIFLAAFAHAGLLLHWGLRPRRLRASGPALYAAAAIAGLATVEDALATCLHRQPLPPQSPSLLMEPRLPLIDAATGMPWPDDSPPGRLAPAALPEPVAPPPSQNHAAAWTAWLTALGNQWLSACEPAMEPTWEALYAPAPPPRIALPTYPFAALDSNAPPPPRPVHCQSPAPLPAPNPYPPFADPSGDLALRLAAVARRNADREAVICDGQRWTYRQFDLRARQLAAYLRRLGLRPGDRIALALPRSLDLAAAMLAVVYLGAAYVPCDGPGPPPFPATGIVAILTAGGPPPRAARRWLHVDLRRDAAAIAAIPPEDAPAPRAADPAAPAALLSSPTRRLLRRGRLAQLAAPARRSSPRPMNGPPPVQLWHHPPCDIASIAQTWRLWLLGGRVVIVPPGSPRRIDALMQLAIAEATRLPANPAPALANQTARRPVWLWIEPCPLALALARRRRSYASPPVRILHLAENRGAASLPAIASFYLAHLRRVQPSGPYHLAGAGSFGLVALEVAHQLRRAGESVAGVVLYQTVRPDLWRSWPPPAAWLARRAATPLAVFPVPLRWRLLRAAIAYTPPFAPAPVHLLFRQPAARWPASLRRAFSALGWTAKLVPQLCLHPLPAHRPRRLTPQAIRLARRHLTRLLRHSSKDASTPTSAVLAAAQRKPARAEQVG